MCKEMRLETQLKDSLEMALSASLRNMSLSCQWPLSRLYLEWEKQEDVGDKIEKSSFLLSLRTMITWTLCV